MPSFIGFVPTPLECVDGFFELTTLSPSDVVYDLGSGDGRLYSPHLKKEPGGSSAWRLTRNLFTKPGKQRKRKVSKIELTLSRPMFWM